MILESLSLSAMVIAEAHTILIASPARNGITQDAIALSKAAPVAIMHHAVPNT